MKKLMASAMLGFCMIAAQAAPGDKEIERVPMGSGLQNARGVENARAVGNYGVWQAPQYMPGFPTAATIWPRVVEVRCAGDRCEGYESTPAVGRGEYLFFKPAPVPVAAAPVVIERIIERTAPDRAISKKINQ